MNPLLVHPTRVGISVILFVLGISVWFLTYDSSGLETAVLGAYRDRWFLFNLIISYICIIVIAILLIKPQKKKVFSLIASHVALILTILFIEFIALIGLIDFRELISRDGRGRNFGADKPDARLRWTTKPNLSVKGTALQDLTTLMGVSSEPIHFDMRTDSLGLRNRTNKIEPKVFILGDSQIAAGYLPFDQSATEIVENLTGLRTMNIAEPGYSPQEELIRLEATGEKIAGGVIVHCIFEGNDLGDSQSWRNWIDRKIKSEYPANGLIKNLLGLLHKPKLNSGNDPSMRISEVRHGNYTSQNGQLERIYYLYDGISTNALMNEFPKLAGMIKSSKKEIRDKGGLYTVAFIPSKITTMYKYSNWPQGSYYSDSRTWESNFRREIQLLCRGENIPFLDFTESLRESAQNGKSPYYPVDTHLNSIGHEVLARSLTSFLKQVYDY